MWCYQVRPWFLRIGLLGLGRGGRRAGEAAGDPAEQVGGGCRIVRERQLMGSSIRLRAPVGAPPPFERTALYHPSPVRCTCGLCVRERLCRGRMIYLTIVNGIPSCLHKNVQLQQVRREPTRRESKGARVERERYITHRDGDGEI